MSEEQGDLPAGDEAGGPDPAPPALPAAGASGDGTAAVSPVESPAMSSPRDLWSAMEDVLERQRAIADAVTREVMEGSAAVRRAGEQSAAVVVGLAALVALTAQVVEAARMRAARTAPAAAAPGPVARWYAGWYAGWSAGHPGFERELRWVREIGAAAARVSKRIAGAAGKFAHDVYVAAAPPNWTEDPSVPAPDYSAAVALAEREGIPMAWVPDPETVRQLLAIPATAPDHRAQLLAILDSRSETILGYCQQRLDSLAPGSAHQQQLVDTAGQTITALRGGLTGPAQSAAANLIDTLVRRWCEPAGGRYRYDRATQQIVALGLRSTPITFTELLSKVTLLREATTLLPVPMAFTQWRPDAGDPVPEIFSRHATAHALHSADQVTPTNALIAVMLAVSLLCQEHASDWTAIRLYTQLTGGAQVPRPQRPSGSPAVGPTRPGAARP